MPQGVPSLLYDDRIQHCAFWASRNLGQNWELNPCNVQGWIVKLKVWLFFVSIAILENTVLDT